MQLSARNQIKGTVHKIRTDGLMAEVIVTVGDQELVSVITRASAESLDLKTGDAVFASVAGADLLASDGAATLYVGTKDGDVYRIVAGGGSERWATGLGRVRGIAVDSAGGRVFLATKQDGRSAIRVLPLPK